MNHRKSLTWLLLLFAGALVAPLVTTVPAQEQPKQPDKKEFGKKDFSPGGIGPMGQRRKLIPQFDKNGDGRLDTEERQAARESIKRGGGFGKGGFGKGGFGGPGMFMAKPMLDALDADKDGKLSREELNSGIKKFFTDADKAKKGTLDETQIADALDRVLPKPQGFPGFPKDDVKPKDGGGFQPKDGFKGPPKGGFFFGPPGKMLAGEILKRADTRKTGSVNLDQLVNAADALFKDADKGNTGKLDEPAVGGAISQLFPAPGGFGPGGFGKTMTPAKPGPKVSPADVASYPDKTLYDTSILRTVFLEFENRKDWEAELMDFYHTDVEVPATVIVDGKTYKNVGVHFRGSSSYFGIPAGYKHSMNLSFDFVDDKQKLYGYKTLNLLNCNQDPTFMHSVLFCNLSRQYIPAPKANLVKVVINGESWGIYANQQQFNKEFTKENFKSTSGARWKVTGNPGAQNSGLRYLGENVEDYKRYYEIKSKDNPKDWNALVDVCRVLDKTPPEKLEDALKKILDVDGVLWFLALDNALLNDDGYWTRASDYNLYRDTKGKFHIVQTDSNETLQPAGFGFGGPKGFPGGPKDGKDGKDGKDFKGPKDGFGKGPKDGGFGKGGPGGGGYNLDPLIGLNDTRAPLRSKLLAVPSFRAKYLKNVHTIASESLNWKKLQPSVGQLRNLIEKEVELDTRKMTSLADFKAATADSVPDGGPGARSSLRAFADSRRNFLLNHPEVKKAVGN